MSLRYFIFIDLLLLLGHQTVTGQSALDMGTTPVYNLDQTREDFEVFRGSLLDFHPGLNWYLSKEQLNSLLDSTYATLNEPLSELAFYTKLATITSAIRCGHLRISPSIVTNNTTWEEGRFLPLDLKFIEGRAYCFRHQSNDTLSIKPGHEILSINEFSMDSLIVLSNSKQSGDGFITTKKVDFLERYFKDFYAFHIGLPDEYILTFVDDLGVKRKVKLKALSMKEIDANRKRKEASPRHGNLALQILNESTAVLRVAAFSDWNHFGKKIKFSKELKRLFFKIDSSKISNLIIDVRDNGGGADQLGLLLFSQFYGDPIIEFNAMHHRLKKSKYTEYSDISNVQIGVMKFLLRSKKIDDSIFAFQGFKTLKPHGPSKPIFNGEVYLLINGRSYSTAVDFAALMKSYGVATFIGEETGGGYYGNTSWLPINVVLPNTKIRMKIPTVRYTTHVKPLFPIGRGVIPDHRIVPSISDEIKGIDTEMNFALQTIKKNE